MTDLLTLHAQEIVAVPGWAPFRFESLASGEMLLTGAVTPVYVRGPKAGKPNWKKRDRSTESKIVISRLAHNAWCRAWGQRTGNCIRCMGGTQVTAGWSKAEGTKYKTCPTCAGSGAYPQEKSPWA